MMNPSPLSTRCRTRNLVYGDRPFDLPPSPRPSLRPTQTPRRDFPSLPSVTNHSKQTWRVPSFLVYGTPFYFQLDLWDTGSDDPRSDGIRVPSPTSWEYPPVLTFEWRRSWTGDWGGNGYRKFFSKENREPVRGPIPHQFQYSPGSLVLNKDRKLLVPLQWSTIHYLWY